MSTPIGIKTTTPNGHPEVRVATTANAQNILTQPYRYAEAAHNHHIIIEDDGSNAPDACAMPAEVNNKIPTITDEVGESIGPSMKRDAAKGGS
mmetsp:Transcript_31900/g.48197  ORF Transcript_31900/g.48197 Transcript_31900/m.48197 type:complete len:93 (+) Transcript_31900:2353-2631(+)